MVTPSVAIELSVAEFALVSASSLVLSVWRFASGRGADDVCAWPMDSRETGAVRVQWRSIRGHFGWPEPTVATRSTLAGTLEISVPDLVFLSHGLLACHADFRDDWEEFCTVGGGAIERYSVGLEDLPLLAKKLRGAVCEAVYDNELKRVAALQA